MSPTIGWSLDTGKLLHCDGLCFIVASHAYSHTTLLLLPCPVSLLCYPAGFVSRSVGCFVSVFLRGALFLPWLARPARFRAIRTIFG